jgi:hypothetical protein
MTEKRDQKSEHRDDDKKFPLPIYNAADDIYNREKEQPLKDEGDVEEIKSDNNAKDPEDDLDIPGAELDDKYEAIGEEDEENNYYSLGGDRHDDLEEDPA